METARRVLFGAMVLERILEMYVRCYQDEVWDVWDYPDYGYYLDGKGGSGAAVGKKPEYLIFQDRVCRWRK